MTTAARPTFEPARGGRGKGEGDLSALSKQYSSRDLPGHTKIKYRWVSRFQTLMRLLNLIRKMLIWKINIFDYVQDSLTTCDIVKHDVLNNYHGAIIIKM